MYEVNKQAVVKITASKNKNGIKEETQKKLLQTDTPLQVAINPFFKFIYDEIQKLRGEN